MGKSTYSRSKIDLLYVEDDQVTRDIVVKMIRMKFPDLVLHIAENGKAGLESYRAHAPQIVVTDINMPVMDGIRMAGEIRALDPEAVIIVVSAYSDTHYLLNAIDIGVNHYLLKPIDHKKLFALLDKCIAGIDLGVKLREQDDHIRKLSRAVEHSPSVVMITDASGTIEYVNPKFIAVTGYAAEEVIGLNPRILKSDGTDPQTFRDLWTTISSGREWHGEFRNRRKDGTLFWEAASISPLFDQSGRISHFVAVKEDITRRKEAERQIELLNTDLAARAAELEAANQELEAFNYSVSHDLRRPLTSINGYCQVILQLCANRLDAESLGYIREIHDGTLRMSQLIQTLLKFSRVSRGEVVRKRVDLSRLANEIAAGHLLAEPERRVAFRIAEDVTDECDAGLMRIVLENLIGNAWKYTARQEEAVIEFGAAGHDCATSCFVRDNGIGFAMEEAERLFIPFHRLHHREDFEGHGIGLSMVQRIIQRHGGQVWAEGEEGRGATFWFTLQP
jgi:PAS domain S-box-containing protein